MHLLSLNLRPLRVQKNRPSRNGTGGWSSGKETAPRLRQTLPLCPNPADPISGAENRVRVPLRNRTAADYVYGCSIGTSAFLFSPSGLRLFPASSLILPQISAPVQSTCGLIFDGSSCRLRTWSLPRRLRRLPALLPGFRPERPPFPGKSRSVHTFPLPASARKHLDTRGPAGRFAIPQRHGTRTAGQPLRARARASPLRSAQRLGIPSAVPPLLPGGTVASSLPLPRRSFPAGQPLSPDRPRCPLSRSPGSCRPDARPRPSLSFFVDRSAELG